MVVDGDVAGIVAEGDGAANEVAAAGQGNRVVNAGVQGHRGGYRLNDAAAARLANGAIGGHGQHGAAELNVAQGDGVDIDDGRTAARRLQGQDIEIVGGVAERDRAGPGVEQ